ncbi:MAG: hypothetical protein WAL32_01480 [Terriglobales bacterium]
MRNTIRTIGKVCGFVFVIATSALAQSRLVSAPSPAVAGPAYNLSAGYSYLTMPIASDGRANLNGVDFAGSIALSPRWGATLDSNYLRTSNVLSTPHQGYVLSFLSGPVFSLIQRGNTRVFLRGLAGAGLVDGAVPVSETSYFHGWLFRPAYAFGGGLERPVSAQLALRLNGDYVRTTFYDAAGTTQAQNSLRLTVSFVFRLKERPHRSSAQVW